MANGEQHTSFTPLDELDQAAVRAAILARASDHVSQPDDVREQVLQCKEFIAAMGWPEVPDARIFIEGKSGFRNVERPVVDAVLRLAAQGEIDVIVCREWERVARVSARRHQIVMTAEDFGVEFRFANLATTRGKMPDTMESRIARSVLEELPQIERDKIVERLTPGKMRRHVEGLPHGGGNGPNYGWVGGERRIGKHGKPMGLLTWVIDEEKARWVRWLFDTVDSSIPEDISLRGLAGELDRRGVPTATGKGTWDATQVKHILTNPKYCGRGRNLRWWIEWKKKKHPRTGIVREKPTAHDRMRDAEAWEKETHQIAAEAIPPIITPEKFERVQEKLKAAAKLKNRGGPRRSDPAAHSTLLDGGLVRCAECNRAMTRYWHSHTDRPFYTCTRRNKQPSHPHRAHQIPAYKVDALALRLLARAITDPEKIIELADAAEEQIAAAQTDIALAAAAEAAYEHRLADIQQQQDNLLAALTALSKARGMERQVADIRAELAKLNHEREEAEEERTHARVPRERVAERAALLRELFTMQDAITDPHAGWPPRLVGLGETHLSVGMWVVVPDKDGQPRRYSRMTLAQAAALLGVSEDAVSLPMVERMEWSADEVNDEGRELIADLDALGLLDAFDNTVDTAGVIELMLQRMPRDRLRKLMRDLDAVVKVARPWSRAEIAARGWTPVEERVSLHLLGSVVVRIDAANISTSSAQLAELAVPPCRRTSGSPAPATS